MGGAVDTDHLPKDELQAVLGVPADVARQALFANDVQKFQFIIEFTQNALEFLHF